MSIQLSIRLAAVAGLAKGAKRLADIGTDHGYLPIYLAQQEGLEYAVAMDVNRGPLLRAQEHIRQQGMEEKIATRLSDGAQKLHPGEADCVVIAGMGGPLTIKILSEGRQQLAETKIFVLQPQSEIESVRRFLHAEGLSITAEDMVKDDGKFYPMMRAVRAGHLEGGESKESRESRETKDNKENSENREGGEALRWEDYEYCFGRYLIRQKNPALQEFLEREEKTCRKILDSLRGWSGEKISVRRKELEKKIEMIETAAGKM